jgi:ABC-type cobalamin/Fe3+-siderophores transport system ATPase subunit
MDVQITIKNYRCFSQSNPTIIQLKKGFTSFVGMNNAGKSSLLKFFYEFRPLFNWLRTSFHNLLQMENQTINLHHPVDVQQLFCNLNEAPLEIEIKLKLAENYNKFGVYHAQLMITIPRNTNSTTISYIYNPPFKPNNESPENINDLPHIKMRDVIEDLTNTCYIGPFRNIVPNIASLEVGIQSRVDKSYLNYFDIEIGRALIQRWRLNKTGSDTKLNLATIEITKDIERIFGLKSLDINSSHDDQTLKLFIDGYPYNLSEVGAGLAQFILVLANVALKQPSYILIDEPELNLHPSLQLDFLTTLGKYASQGVLFATHSIGLARACSELIYTVRKTDQGSKVIQYEKNPSLSEFLGELSFSAYREFGFNKILLVEGRTEIKTIHQFLRKYGKDHEILVLSLAGKDLITDKARLELEEIKRISDKIFVIIDSEKGSAEAELEPERKRFVQMCEEMQINCHVLERRAIENYFPDQAVKQVKGEKYTALTEYQLLKKAAIKWSKSENWQIAQAMSREDLEATDLGQFIKLVCEED